MHWCPGEYEEISWGWRETFVLGDRRTVNTALKIAGIGSVDFFLEIDVDDAQNCAKSYSDDLFLMHVAVTMMAAPIF